MNVQWSYFGDAVLDNSWRYASMHSTMDLTWLLIIQVKYFYNERIDVTSVRMRLSGQKQFSSSMSYMSGHKKMEPSSRAIFQLQII